MQHDGALIKGPGEILSYLHIVIDVMQAEPQSGSVEREVATRRTFQCARARPGYLYFPVTQYCQIIH